MFDNSNILDMKKAEIVPIAKDEIFVQVYGTWNYWISNYGRLTNNLRNKYVLHKTGNVHWTINACYIGNIKCPKDTYPRDLVAEHFLKKVKGKNRIWIIDRDKANNYYKNLMYVDDQEYYDLNLGKIKIEDIMRIQEYIPYLTAKSNRAYIIYNGILNRCYNKDTKEMFPWYEKVSMCGEWRNNPDSFVNWYENNYYEINGESMQVDKDLLIPGNKEYAPDKCCILPERINSLLANSKKLYQRDDSLLARKLNTELPLGVRHNKSKNKYFGQITIEGEVITLGLKDTPEEAFADYKRHKEAYILFVADKYKNKIPKNIYEALLNYSVKPY